MSIFCNVIMLLLSYVHVCVTRTGWKTRPRPKTVILSIKKSNQIKFDHGSTCWLSCLFDCCSVACGCRDRCGRNNLCRKGHICVWSLVCWSCCAPLCGPFFLLLQSPAFFPVLRCWFRVFLLIMRSAAKSSQESVLMSSAFMSLLQTSL